MYQIQTTVTMEQQRVKLDMVASAATRPCEELTTLHRTLCEDSRITFTQTPKFPQNFLTRTCARSCKDRFHKECSKLFQGTCTGSCQGFWEHVIRIPRRLHARTPWKKKHKVVMKRPASIGTDLTKYWYKNFPRASWPRICASPRSRNAHVTGTFLCENSRVSCCRLRSRKTRGADFVRACKVEMDMDMDMDTDMSQEPFYASILWEDAAPQEPMLPPNCNMKRVLLSSIWTTPHTQKKKHRTTVCQKKILNKGRCWFHFFPSHPQVSQTGKNISASNLHETGKMRAWLDMIRMAKTNLRSLGSRSVSFFKTEKLEKL